MRQGTALAVVPTSGDGTNRTAQGGGQAGSGQDGGQQRHGQMRQVGGIGMLLHHCKDFTLTDEQLDKLEALLETNELEKAKLRYDEQAAKIKFRYAIRRADADEAAVRSAAEAVGKAELELRLMRFRHLQTARALLSPDQCRMVTAFRRAKRGERGQGQGGQARAGG